MRIEGPKSTSDIKKSEKTRKSSGTGSAFSAYMDDDGPQGASAAKGSAPMAGIGSLLAVQGAEDPSERKSRKKMMERADRVLDALDGVHKGLVHGNLSVQHMDDVNRAIKENREKVSDAKLLEILDEVELRAQVELAKLELAREKSKK